ncbi:MAG TPA: T9SS type A sorting domain-containing protein [Chitinophagales bacterium]|nr:T9SS type A sorting domain-containing protein [Chitinophagales bacterium]
MKKIFYSSLFLAIIACSTLRAQTYISSAIVSDANWTVANSPYIVTTDVGLFPNITLTIDPGVTVEFDNNASLDIKGTLVAVGDQNDSITFTSSSVAPYEGIWDGIQIENSQGGNANFCYCRGFYADALVEVMNSGPSDTIIIMKKSRFSNNIGALINYDGLSSYTVILDSCKFESNLSVAVVFGNYMTVANCSFINNSGALYSDRINPTCSNCIFSGNGGTYTISFAGTITGCTFTNNAEGMRVWNTTQASDNIITGNTIGLNLINTTNIFAGQVVNNYICSNTTYNASVALWGNSNISGNCWCTTDSAAISASIYDAYDNGTLGIVTFMPLGASCTPLGETTIAANSATNLPHSFPNPFSTSITIQFNLNTASQTSLQIFDVNGSQIRSLFQNEILNPGTHSVNFYAENNPAGLYYYVLSCNEKAEVGKMVLVR